jgi:hypothetical protein
MELESAADFAVLGGDYGFKLSHTDLSSPAQPWAGVSSTSGFGGALFLSE